MNRISYNQSIVLTIAYQIENQNQSISVNAIEKQLGWMNEHVINLEYELDLLIKKGFMNQNDHALVLTDTAKGQDVCIFDYMTGKS